MWGGSCEFWDESFQVICLRHLRSSDAGGGSPGAASRYSEDRRGSSRSGTRSHDKGVCADGGSYRLLLGVASVYVYNQRTQLTKVPEVGLLAGVLPISPMNQVGMLTGYVDPGETFIADPNQDVVYGLGYLSLEKEPVVIQVPDFGDRFWTVPVYDARTDQISELGLQYGTKPGFYMVVGPSWKGATPAGIAGVVRSTTDFAVTMPRIFMNDTPEDHAAIQPALSQIQFYPLSQFDGKMKTKDWNKLPTFPVHTKRPGLSIRPSNHLGLTRRCSSTNYRP